MHATKPKKDKKKLPIEEVAMPRKGIPYSRFSGKRQEAGTSKARQDAMALAAAQAEGVPLDDSFCLSDDGISAFRGANWHRGDLGKFLDLVDAGLILPGWVLIIERVNRMSRAPWMRQVELWKEILERGIIIRTCEPPARYTRENINELSVGCPVVIHMMLANLESQQKSDWLRWAWADKKKKAREAKTPHGCNVLPWLQPVTMPHPKDSTRTVTTSYELMPERASLVLQMFEWASAGWGSRRIAGELERRGLACWMPAGRWDWPTVHYLLRCRQVLGEYTPSTRNADGVPEADEPIPGYYPTIPGLTEELWGDVQVKIAARRRHGGRPGRKSGEETNLFTHLVYEAESRLPLYVNSSWNPRQKTKQVRHYLVSKKTFYGLPYDIFEAAVLDTLARLKSSDIEASHQASEANALVDRLQGELTRLGVDLDSLDAQLRELPPEKRSKRVVARMGELEAAVEQKTDELVQAKEAANTTGRSEMLTELQTCIQLLAEVAGTDREPEVRRRAKGRISLLVESVWVRMQRVSAKQRYLHLRLYLRVGEPRYVCVPIFEGQLARRPLAAPAWILDDADFRAGDVGGEAVSAKPTAQLTA